MTAPLPPVRVGTRADEVDLLALCHELHADNGLFEMDDDAVKGMLNLAFDRKGGVIAIIDGEGEIAAAIYMCLTKMWYTHEDHVHLEELFSFVRPKYRKSKNAEALIEFAKNCAKTAAIPLFIGVLTNKRLEAKVRLYRKKLGLPSGAFFVYGVKAWANENVMDTKDLWRVHRDHKRGNGVEAG